MEGDNTNKENKVEDESSKELQDFQAVFDEEEGLR